MKKMIIIIMVVLTLAGYQKEAKASLAKRYFPLNVGNSWTYTNYYAPEPNTPDPEPGSPAPPPPWPPGPQIVEFTFTIIGTEEIDGQTYYVFNDYFNIYPPPPTPVPEPKWRVTVGYQVLFRYDSIADTVLMYRVYADDRIRYDLTGNEWIFGELVRCCLKQSGVTCDVPAGEFSDCINFGFGNSSCSEYLAPNVGVIKYSNPLSTFMLKSYTIVPQPAIDATIDLDPDVFGVKFGAHKKPKKPRKPRAEFLRAFIELPADVNVSDVNVATVNLCLNDTILAAAESPLIVDNILDVLFRLDPHNVGAILGLEVTKVKVDECRIEVTAAAAPSQPIDLIELTVSGELMYPGSFTGTDAVRVMLGNDDKHEDNDE